MSDAHTEKEASQTTCLEERCELTVARNQEDGRQGQARNARIRLRDKQGREFLGGKEMGS